MDKYRECGIALHRREGRYGHLCLDIGLLANFLGYGPIGGGQGTSERPLGGSSGCLGGVRLWRERWH